MWASLLSIPVMLVLLMVQTAFGGAIHLGEGMTDLLLVTVAAWSIQEPVKNGLVWAVVAGALASLVSAFPFPYTFVAYCLVAILAARLKGRVWQNALLSLLLVVVLGTALQYGLDLIVLESENVAGSILNAIEQVVLPSMILNLLFSLPIYALTNELANLLYPVRIEQ